MSPRRRQSGAIAANPILIGAATVLIVVVGVFLAYNANNGLPFVPTYALNVNVPSAAQLVKGNDVRYGGTRVGVVSDITPVTHRNGTVTALLHLKLQTSAKPLPVDSTVIVRPRSALGLKYVEITKGTSKRSFPDGATVPLSQATPKPVELDEVLGMFDDKTRAASQQNLLQLGNAVAGRGLDINEAIEAFNPLVLSLRPVMENLAAPRTGLAKLFVALDQAASQTAPMAEQQASLFRGLDATFSAISDVRDDYAQAIVNAPPAEDAAIKGLPIQQVFLRNSEDLFRELRPGVHALSKAAPDLADAFEVGTGTLRRSVAFNKRLKPTFAALQRFAEDPLVTLGVQDLTNTAQIAAPTVAHLTPAQTVCNYATLFFRNVGSLLSEGDANGTSQRFIIIAAPQGVNAEGGPSAKPADGPGADNHLHTNPYPNTASPGETAECEAGNETYLPSTTIIGNVPGNQGELHDKTTISTGGTG